MKFEANHLPLKGTFPRQLHFKSCIFSVHNILCSDWIWRVSNTWANEKRVKLGFQNMWEESCRDLWFDAMLPALYMPGFLNDKKGFLGLAKWTTACSPQKHILPWCRARDLKNTPVIQKSAGRMLWTRTHLLFRESSSIEKGHFHLGSFFYIFDLLTIFKWSNYSIWRFTIDQQAIIRFCNALLHGLVVHSLKKLPHTSENLIQEFVRGLYCFQWKLGPNHRSNGQPQLKNMEFNVKIRLIHHIPKTWVIHYRVWQANFNKLYIVKDHESRSIIFGSISRLGAKRPSHTRRFDLWTLWSRP